MSSGQQNLTRSLEELVSSFSREQGDHGEQGEEWNSFEDNMLATDASASAGQGSETLSQWEASASPPSFLSGLSQSSKPEGGEVLQGIANSSYEFEEDRADGEMSYAQSIEEANHWSLWQYQNSSSSTNFSISAESDASAHSAASAHAPEQQSTQQRQDQQSIDLSRTASAPSTTSQQHNWDESTTIAALQSQQPFLNAATASPKPATNASFLPLPTSIISQLSPQQSLQQMQQNSTAGSFTSQLLSPLPLTPQPENNLNTGIAQLQQYLQTHQQSKPNISSENLLHQLHPQLQRLHLQRLQQASALQNQVRQQIRDSQFPPATLAQIQLHHIQHQRQSVEMQLEQLRQIQQQAQNYHQQAQIQQAQAQHQAHLQQLQQKQAQIHAQLRHYQQQPQQQLQGRTTQQVQLPRLALGVQGQQLGLPEEEEEDEDVEDEEREDEEEISLPPPKPQSSRKRAAASQEGVEDIGVTAASSSSYGLRSRNSLAKRRLVAPDPTLESIKQENLQTEVHDILRQLGKGDVSLHIYENAQRVYLRYIQDEKGHMVDLAEFFPVHFHSEGTIGVPIPKQPISALNEIATRASVHGDREIRSLNLSFKRKEHYWRRGIWVRVVVDVMSGEGVAKDATGSINVELFSLRGEPIKKACEKCSKYYFRYKNIEPSGELAPAFEIEEHDRNTAVTAGRASFNMRVWECSHHYLTPHTLAFSWINPMNPSMRVEAICPKEIVISSGSGQEKKLREMRVNADDLFKEFIDALILMDDGKYTQAIESLRCIRWKAFHFLGPFLATCVDEKIADCFLRTGNYQTAINHFNRTLSLLGESGDRIIPSLKYYMQALLYLKVATAAYYKARESTASEMSFNLQKAQKYLEISYNSIKNAKEQETKDAPQNVHDFAKQYLKYSYYQDLMGICLKMKPFETNESEQNLSLQKMVEAFKELEINYTKLDEDKLWSGPELMSVFGPLADKLHITVDKLKKLLHSPFLTNQAITRPVLSGSSSLATSSSHGEVPAANSISTSSIGDSVPMDEASAQIPISVDSAASTSPLVGLEQTKEILMSLKQAQEEAEELHPKGHRTICISRCLSTLFMYLSGDIPEEEALKKIEEATKEIEQFWVNERVGGKFEVQQFASIVNFLRSGQRDNFNLENPFSIFLEREEFQLYRLWIHSPLDVIFWAIMQLSPA